MVLACKSVASRISDAVISYHDLSGVGDTEELVDFNTNTNTRDFSFSSGDCFKFISSSGLLLNDLTWDSELFNSESMLKQHHCGEGNNTTTGGGTNTGTNTGAGTGTGTTNRSFAESSVLSDPYPYPSDNSGSKRHRRNILDLLSSIRAVAVSCNVAVATVKRIDTGIEVSSSSGFGTSSGSDFRGIFNELIDLSTAAMRK